MRTRCANGDHVRRVAGGKSDGSELCTEELEDVDGQDRRTATSPVNNPIDQVAKGLETHDKRNNQGRRPSRRIRSVVYGAFLLPVWSGMWWSMHDVYCYGITLHPVTCSFRFRRSIQSRVFID